MGKSADLNDLNERATYNHTPSVVAATARLMKATSMNRTDVVNQAILRDDFLRQEQAKGLELCLRDPKTGVVERIHLI
jgi:hypothetical protein